MLSLEFGWYESLAQSMSGDSYVLINKLSKKINWQNINIFNDKQHF